MFDAAMIATANFLATGSPLIGADAEATFPQVELAFDMLQRTAQPAFTTYKSGNLYFDGCVFTNPLHVCRAETLRPIKFVDQEEIEGSRRSLTAVLAHRTRRINEDQAA